MCGDPFARNSRLCTYTNDLNPATSADYHLDALNFLLMIEQFCVLADVFVLDPPHSPRQLSECYAGIGRWARMQDTQRPGRWAAEREVINHLVRPGQQSHQLWLEYIRDGIPAGLCARGVTGRMPRSRSQ